MRGAAPAVAAAEAGQGIGGSGQGGEAGDQIAFVAARQGQQIVEFGDPAQMVDVPMRGLVDGEMPAQPGAQAAGAIGAAAIEIAAGAESGVAQTGDGQNRRARQSQRQDIGAARDGKGVGIEGYSVLSSVLRRVSVSPARTKATAPLEAL